MSPLNFYKSFQEEYGLEVKPTTEEERRKREEERKWEEEQRKKKQASTEQKESLFGETPTITKEKLQEKVFAEEGVTETAEEKQVKKVSTEEVDEKAVPWWERDTYQPRSAVELLENLGGTANAAVSLVVNGLLFIPTGLAGIAGGEFAATMPGGKGFAEGGLATMESIQEAVHFVVGPHTETGKKLVDAISLPFEKLHGYATDVGDEVLKETDNPELAAAAATTVEAAPYIILTILGGKLGRRIRKKAPSAAANNAIKAEKVRKANEVLKNATVEEQKIVSSAMEKVRKKLWDIEAEELASLTERDVASRLGKEFVELYDKTGKLPKQAKQAWEAAKKEMKIRDEVSQKAYEEQVKKAQTEAPPKKPTEAMTPEERKLYDVKSNLEESAVRKAEMIDKEYLSYDIPWYRKPEKWKRLYKLIQRQGWDVSGPIKGFLRKNLGKDGAMVASQHELIKGYSAKAVVWTRRAERKIYKGLTRFERKMFDDLAAYKRIVEIDNYKGVGKVKHPGGMNGPEAAAMIDRMKRQMGEEAFAKVEGKLHDYYAAFDELLKAQLDAELISEGFYKELSKYKHYNPRQFLEYLDPLEGRTVQKGGRQVSVTSSGIEKLRGGSEKALVKNTRFLLEQAAFRTFSRIYKNKANRAAWDLARKHPENGIFKILWEKEGKKPKYDRKKWDYTDLFMKGEKRRLLIKREYGLDWRGRDPYISGALTNVIGWLSGSKILKPMATGINPFFALTNIPRDIALIWISTDQYSSFLPKAAGQMARDLASVAWDSVRRKGSYNEYINEGGGMNFLVTQGKLGRALESPGKPGSILKQKLSTLQDVLAYVGETSEIWTRLALRRRGLRNHLSPTEATAVARSYLDFQQGGQFTKAVDSGIPYLNAATQATRSIFRSAKDKPVKFSAKVGQLATLSTGLYVAAETMFPEVMEQVSHRERVNNFIIPLGGLWFEDKEGNKRYLYLKIAKDQGQRVWCTIFENVAAKMMDKPVDMDSVTKAVGDFIPYTPTTLPPTASAILGYAMNKDFWINKDIWRGPRVEERAEISDYTHPAIVELAKGMSPFSNLATGKEVSPERLQFALKEVFTRGNIYTSIMGGGLKAIMGELDEDQRGIINTEMVRNLPGIHRIIGQTDPYNKFAKSIEDERIRSNTNRYLRSRDFDDLLEKFEETGRSNARPLRDFIQNQPREVREQLLRRAKEFLQMSDLPSRERRWWMAMKSLNPESRALEFWIRYRQAPEGKHNEMLSKARQVSGIWSDRFQRRFQELEKTYRYTTEKQRKAMLQGKIEMEEYEPLER